MTERDDQMFILTFTVNRLMLLKIVYLNRTKTPVMRRVILTSAAILFVVSSVLADGTPAAKKSKNTKATKTEKNCPKGSPECKKKGC